MIITKLEILDTECDSIQIRIRQVWFGLVGFMAYQTL